MDTSGTSGRDVARSEVLSVEVDASIAVLWLDRPEARNAMGPAFFSDLPGIVGALDANPKVRAIVVAARGPHFSVGLDLKAMASVLAGEGAADAPGVSDPGSEMPAGPSPSPPSPSPPSPSPPSMARRAQAARQEILRLQGAVTSVAQCAKPVVAAIHGYCIGGGVDLAAACDIRVASADALFSVRETRMAIVADLGSLQRLPAIISAGHLAELAFTGKDIDAERALRIGLVNDVLPDAAATLDAARAVAAEIAANSPLAVQGTKAVLAACRDRTLAEGLDYVATWNAGFLQSDDLVEAMTAFLSKRKPEFRGR